MGVVTACAGGGDNSMFARELAGTWSIRSVDARGSLVSPLPAVEPTLTLEVAEDPDRPGWYALAGSGGCNEFTGSYRPGPEGAWTMGTMASTEKGCMAEIMDFDVMVAFALGRVNGYRLDGSTLVLTSSMGDITLERP